MKYRKKPVVVEARQWAGGEYEWLNEFCGLNWARADAVDMVNERKETCFTCGAWEDEPCPRQPCEYIPHSATRLAARHQGAGEEVGESQVKFNLEATYIKKRPTNDQKKNSGSR